MNSFSQGSPPVASNSCRCWARAHQVPLQAATVAIRAVLDPSKPVRPEVSLFNAVRLHFHLKGVTQEQGAQLIEAFKRR